MFLLKWDESLAIPYHFENLTFKPLFGCQVQTLCESLQNALHGSVLYTAGTTCCYLQPVAQGWQ